VSASAVPLRGADGKVEAVVATFVEVTRLQQVQEQRDDLLRIMSHDLRTPLSALLLQAQMLQRSLTPGDRNAKRVDTIIANGQRLDTMIRDLVDMARLEDGQVKLARRPIDVQAFMTALVERMAGTLPTQRLRLSFEPRLPPLPADPDRLERVLVNLLGNALKYSDAPAEVLVHSSCAGGDSSPSRSPTTAWASPGRSCPMCSSAAAEARTVAARTAWAWAVHHRPVGARAWGPDRGRKRARQGQRLSRVLALCIGSRQPRKTQGCCRMGSL
jgi:signal transduction histidine kinase